MYAYVKRHWTGQQSLVWSFWVNLVLIRVVVFFMQNELAPIDGTDYSSYRPYVLAAVLVIHIVLFVWQVVGVVRSAESHFSEHGNMALVWGSHLGTILMVVLTAVYALGAVQMALRVPEEVDVLARMSEEHASKYRLELSANHRTLRMDGIIELGITRAVKKLLLENPTVENVVLNSSGGNIYEGRGLGRLFKDSNINTHVEIVCASACTIAFAGGVKRRAESTARFGFHQYRVDADYTIITTDVVKEQLRDQDLLLDAGIDPDFVAAVFSHPSESMWWPALQELQTAGFLHGINTEAR